MIIAINLILFIALFCGLYLITVQHMAKKRGIDKVEAGPMDKVDEEKHQKKSNASISIWTKFETRDGKTVNKSKFKTLEVDGDCMDPINIHKGDIILYKSVDSRELKSGDLVVLEIKDEQKSTIKKIRVINQILSQAPDNRILETYYFIRNKDEWFKKRSTKNHREDQVIGIVQYKIDKEGCYSNPLLFH